MRCSAYVIATTSELPSVRHHGLPQQQTGPAAATDDDLIAGEFYVIQYVHHREPVHGFLGRHLRRRLIAQSHRHSSVAAATARGTAGCGPMSSDLARVVDWLPRVWQKVNKFLDIISPPSKLDITIGNFTT